MEANDRSNKSDRRGIVLILALGMLTMFTVIAITLAAIAKSEATAAGNFKRVEQFGTLKLDVAPDEIDDLFRVAMNQLIYDTRNTSSAIRGHSLLRDMYGSPDKYAIDLNSGTPVPKIQNTGAELRFRKADDANLKLFFGSNWSQNYDYQGVYNGTGVFLPKKMDFSPAFPTLDPSRMAELSRLSNAEIALQTAFFTVPSSMGAHVATQLPPSKAAWATLFTPSTLGGPSVVGNNVRFFYPRFPLNYQVFDQFVPSAAPGTGRPSTPTYPDGKDITPELFYASTAPADDIATPNIDERSLGKHWFGFDEDYDYPDVNNMFLAMERADGTILIPSFHRPGLTSQVARGIYEMATGSALSSKAELDFAHNLPWLRAVAGPIGPIPNIGDALRGLVLRPRSADYDLFVMSNGVAQSKAGRFKELSDVTGDGLPDDLDGSGAIGDSPMELDVDTDGDGKKDAIWVDLGAPVMTVGNTSFKPMFAFKVIDLDSKINLNVHGNLVRAPQSGGGTVSHPLQHSSHLGASVTEINPMYGFILGDNIPANNSLVPDPPTWSFADGITPDSSPYKRLLLGDQRITPSPKGRWNPPDESLVTTDNGPGRSQPGDQAADLTASDDNQNMAFDASEGDGSPIPVTGGSGLPALMGRYGSIDPIGVGRTYSPFSKTARDNAGAFGHIAGEGNFHAGLLNHIETSQGLLGARMEAVRDGSNNTAVTRGGLRADFVGADEAAEFNAYVTENNADSPFTASEIARLLRDNDIDTSVQNNRLALLNPQQWHSRQADVTSGASQTPGYLSREIYAQRRMRRLFTHESWDLIRYNAPPTTSFLTLAGAALPNDSLGLFGRAVASLPPNNAAALPPYTLALANKHTGNLGYSKLFSDLLLNADIKTLINGLVGNIPDPNVQNQAANYIKALETFRTTPTSRGEPQELLLPIEVQNGRRFDLNRPLAAYTAANHAAVDLEREGFAQQIYVLLYLSSGAFGPDSSQIAPLRVRLGQARTLAQLAVNIVDFIDPDNVMTRMRFDPDLSNGWNVDVAGSATNVLSNGTVLDVGSTPADSDGGLGVAGGDEEVARSVMTVFGFELPELVINESLTVVAEEIAQNDPNDPNDNERYEHTWNWVELFCPWPSYRDPLDNQDGLALATPIGAVGAEPKSVYLIGLQDRQEELSLNAETPESDISITASSTVGAAGGVPRFVRFINTGTDVVYAPTGATQPPRVPARIDGQSGYYMVGPRGTENFGSYTLELLPAGVWTPPTAASTQGDNDYTANALNYIRKVTKQAAVPPDVDVKLYRLRNPYAPHDIQTNPYVVIDSVRNRAANRPLSGRYWRRDLNGTLDGSEKTIVGTQAGAYYVPDPNEMMMPPNMGNVLPSTDPSQRLSLQRKQPWHGYNAEWTPYGRNQNHPLYGTYLGNSTTGRLYYEGLFLGLPSLADNGFVNADDPDKPHSADGSSNGGHHQENAMEQSGFAADSANQATFKVGARRNSNAFNTWLSFPFANRQLANPLELLSVRLYGSHGWFLPTTPTVNSTDSEGYIDDIVDNVEQCRLEWKLRFTDDFEFAVHAWRPSPGTSGIDPNESKYERVWRDRHVPWYLDNRLGFPNWGSGDRARIEPADVAAIIASGGSDFTSIGDGIRTHSGPQFLAPFPHLYRFFEFVECRSRMKNSRDLVANLAWTQRDDRVPGKVNLNTITEEEVYKGVVDSVSAMYVDPLVFVNVLNGQPINAAALLNSPYWPTGYGASLFTPLGETPAIGGVPSDRDLGAKLVPWMGLALSQTTSNTLTWNTVSGSPTASVVIFNSGFEYLAAELWPGFASDLISVLTSPPSNPLDGLAQLVTSLRNQQVSVVPSILSGTGGSPINPGYFQSPNNQWPGIINGPDFAAPGVYPGTDPNSQVSSEMFRSLLLSRAGADGVVGTGDDKPFRSFASDDVSDTILRPRNIKSLDFVHGASIDLTVINDANAAINPTDGRSGAIAELFAATFTDGTDDVYPISGANIGVGDYIVRLGGQFTPRLFDPIPDPYTEDVRLILNYAAAPDALGPRIPNLTNDANDAEALDYWMLESRRNEIQAKISGNVTTRSHVFAVWVTVGLFRVEPGTEDLRIPLLGAEVGSERGQPVRHRAFFIVDRSKAKAYDPEDIDANYELPQIQSKGIIEYYKILE